MEKLSCVPMVSLEVKIPTEASLPEQFLLKISKYIMEQYQEDPLKFSASFQELDRIRRHISRCSPDVETLCIYKNYYSQLLMMKKRFPMEEGDSIAIPFSWIDRGTDLSTPLVYEDVNFELCCVLFNISAIHSIIAANETRSTLDSIKNAFINFQCAAWPLQYMRDDMRSSHYSVMDFDKDILTFYLNVFLAQAQECILEKSFIERRNYIARARISLHLHTLYAECANLLDSELLTFSKMKELIKICRAKSELYGAISHYCRGLNATDNQEMGIRLAHFSFALENIKRALKLVEKDKSELKQAIQFVLEVITQEESKSRKENDIIYHQLVPKREDLEKIEGVNMVKPISFDPCDPSVCGEDLFKSLLPFDVIKAISLYSESKSQLKRNVMEKIEQKNNDLEQYLALIRLDQLNLDQPEEQTRLPDELLRCSAVFTTNPDAYQNLFDSFYKLTTQSNEAERSLMDMITRLKRIDDPSFTSDKGYKIIEEKVLDLIKQQEKARESNTELQHAMASHSENLKLLSLPLNELTKFVCGEFLDPCNSKEGKELLLVRDKVDEMRRQRAYLLKQFTEELEKDDISKRALAERDFDSKRLFETELKKHDHNIELIDKNLQAQETILTRLTEANANFADFRQRIIENAEKRKVNSLTLITSYKAFDGIVEGTKKALNFYEQLASKIKTFQKGVKNIEDAYNEVRNKHEAEQFVAEWGFK